jgi:hypothetical protein
MAPRERAQDSSRRLLDHLAGSRELGTPQALFATTFDLDRDFVELDYLPTVLGVSTWDDTSLKGRLELEQQLARVDTIAIAMDGRRYQGRPRSLRVHLTPAVLPHSALHAKVNLIVHDDAVRLLVASANLTGAGYRTNREVALSIVATEKRGADARLIQRALEPMRAMLAPWWTPEAESVVSSASAKLGLWASPPEPDDDVFLWSGPGMPLWTRFLERWPAHEHIDAIHVVSPFWSPEGGDGPFTKFIGTLRARNALTERTCLKLITRAERDQQASFCPRLPRGLADFDFSSLGVAAVAGATSPEVDAADIGRDDLRIERGLHAKAVLLEGPNTSLAYIGSANFTVPGWGFGADAWMNVEAGLALLRRGRAREKLRAVLPRTCSEVPLRGSTAGIFVADDAAEEDQARPFPSFLRSVELCPEAANTERLELSVTLNAEPPSFSIVLGDTDNARVLLTVNAPSTKRTFQVPLEEPDLIRDLLRQRAIRVHWPAPGSPVEFPINVSPAARQNLPFADPGALPRENELIAYYQGRIAFADVFPEEAADETHTTPSPTAGSTVDTSDILSYRVRDFVEALPGIERELGASTATPNTIRLAFLGPVSPIALAREIVRETTRGRSPTAAGFQLVELLACVRRARPIGELSERHRLAWSDASRSAEQQILGLQNELKQRFMELASSPTFERYESSVLGTTRGAP